MSLTTQVYNDHQSAKDAVLGPMGNETNGDSIVISGMAGLYPQARYIKDLESILYNKLNPISSENLRWKYNHPEVSNWVGNVPDLDRFDAQFFKVHNYLGKSMDPMLRKLLEQAYEAIYDAGVNPKTLSGRKIGVYIGSCFSETEKIGIYKPTKTGYGITGSNKAMFANRISYWLNVKGPSYSIDQACCSSIVALEAACDAIYRGECEAALVGGANLCLHPQSLVHHGRLMNFTGSDGKTKSFAADADGCAKSEAINVIFLQRTKDAKRIYAQVIHVKSEFVSLMNGQTGPRYGAYRDRADSAKFLETFYRDAGVSPVAVEYVEAFGSAMPEADRTELETIDEVFCRGREKPLFVGSVMSNIGYGEAASGISSITKVLLGFHKGTLAGNLHCSKPRLDIEALNHGRIHLTTDHHRFGRTFVAVNNLSVAGVNAHVLLHGRYKPKDLNRYSANIPRLVTVSGRQESAVARMFQLLKAHPIDPEELALLHNIHETNISGHLGKGYTILDTSSEGSTLSLSERVERCDSARRPLWFVYSGMGSQWAGMGAQLMRIPIFASAIARCQKVLEPKGLDIFHIITCPDPRIFENILHSFVGIAAVQIGLTDVMLQLGLIPDNIIGHSVGELGCAYADGCLTAEEMILAAYSRGRVSLDTPLVRGSMAAVGMGAHQMSLLCPPEIAIACHNSADSCTISGPAETMRSFVEILTAQGIFAKEVPCSNIAYHSPYIAEAGPGLLKYLKEVITTPRARSDRWISTSVPRDRWHESAAKYSSAEYHTNNLLSPVLLEEASVLIPLDAVLVEVAPHGLLQAILKRALPSTANIPLTRRGHEDNVVMLLDAIGKLYLHGFNPKVRVLYPTVEFPVSTGTPFLSHYVEWAHEDKWALPLYQTAHRTMTASCTFVTTIHDDNCYLQGHVIKNKILLPYAYALVAAWDTLVMSLNTPKKSLSVRFKDIKFYAQPTLHSQKVARLSVSLHRGNGLFEIMEEDTKVCKGYIAIVKNTDIQLPPESKPANNELNTRDVYHILYGRGYGYSHMFRSIHSTNSSITTAKLIWNDNWVTFIDGLFQLNLLKYTDSYISLPDRIGRLVIDVKKHFYCVTNKTAGNDTHSMVNVELSDIQGRTSSGGVSIENMRFHNVPQGNDDRTTVCPLEVPKSCSGFNSTSKDKYHQEESVELKGELTLRSEVIGDIDSMQWAPASKLSGPGILVKVHYSSINIGDVKHALGVSSGKNYRTYGMEFSGITESDDRVMGLMACGAACRRVIAQPELSWPVPSHWTMEDAATVPFAYVYAYYCLIMKTSAKIFIDEVKQSQFSVLVHDGISALGQAVISISLARGWRVFTTVSDFSRKKILMRLYPELNENDIGNSRDTSFGDMVLHATNSQGCNIVICCLQGELKNISLKCCAPSCTVVDTTQIFSNEDYSYGMSNLRDDRSYVAADLGSIFSSPKDMKILHALVSEGIARGEVRPLTRVCFELDDVMRAFRLLATSRHRGCVLLRLKDGLVYRKHDNIPAQVDECHVIVCGSSPLGAQVADKLIEIGVKKLHLHLKAPAGYLQYRLRVWEKNSIQVTVTNGDLETRNDCTEFLLHAKNLGPVEGLYIIADNTLREDAIENIDVTTRTLCPYLKRFMVLACDSNINLQNLCVQRVKSGFSGTFLDLSMLEKLRDPNSDICVRGATNAVERATRIAAGPILLATPNPPARLTLVQHVAALADLKILNETPDTTPLDHVGMSSEKSSSVCAFLKNVYNISVDEEKLPQMTLSRLKQIEERDTESQLEEKRGLHMFYSIAASDELLATSEMVFLPTLTNNYVMRDDEFDVKDICLCIIPGLEGHHARFRALSERLKLPAFVLQPGLDYPHETPAALALRYSKILIKKTGLKAHTNFYILGYETGVMVALHLAAILEEHGLIRSVFCVGDGPVETQALLERELSSYPSEEALQDAVARHMFDLLTHGSGSGTIAEDLSTYSSWDTRVDACVRSLLGYTCHSAQYARGLLLAAYARIHAARTRIAEFTLHSRIVLLRAKLQGTASENDGNIKQSQDSCSLQRFSRQPLAVRELSTPLSHATADLRISAIVNSFLDDTILQAFEKKNLCDTNLTNADAFMTLN